MIIKLCIINFASIKKKKMTVYIFCDSEHSTFVYLLLQKDPWAKNKNSFDLDLVSSSQPLYLYHSKHMIIR